jgi:hypothetical protein
MRVAAVWEVVRLKISRLRPTGWMSAAELTRLVYELLDADDDTARLAAELAADARWRGHLEYLRDLQRHRRESLAPLAGADQPRSLYGQRVPSRVP